MVKNSKIFNWYSAFDNKLIYRHILWFFNFYLNRMLKFEHLYFDGTFITTKEFYELIRIMYYDASNKKKYLMLYINR